MIYQETRLGSRHVETWPRHIRKKEEFDEIPYDLRSFYEVDTGAGFKPNIYLIYCPKSERMNAPLSEKLFYVFDSALYYIERVNSEPFKRRFDAENIQVLETGFVLLDSWMTIAGHTDNGNETFTVYYNHVISSFFERMVELLRIMILNTEYPPIYDNTVSSGIADDSYEYMNYTRNIIFEDEAPVKYVFQPALTDRHFKSSRTALTNSHILMITSCEFIQITAGKTTMDRYGHIKTFYIKNHLNSPEFLNANGGCSYLILSSGVYKRKVMFNGNNMPDVMALTRSYIKEW